MTTYPIFEAIKSSANLDKLVRQYYLVNPTASFKTRLEKAHEILHTISERFLIPISHIKVTGSAHLGYSFVKQRNFLEKQSDLDLAIIDIHFYNFFFEKNLEETRQYSRQDKFGYSWIGKEKVYNLELYKEWLAKGLIHEKYLPNTDYANEFKKFFNELSIKHSDTFKSISACVYSSEQTFKLKQISSIHRWRSTLPKDKK
ncbi:MAG: hypothetical protein ACN6N1_15690 [Acinetobacter guillouiae]